MEAPSQAEKHGGAPHSKLSLRLWLRLLSCSLIIDKRIRQKLIEDFGTTLPRFDVLAALDRAPAGLTMSNLSSRLLVSNGNVTSIVTRLIEDGMVETITSPLDRRSTIVQLTKPGQRSFRKIAHEHEDWIETAFSDLSDRDLLTLMDGLGRVRDSVQKNLS